MRRELIPPFTTPSSADITVAEWSVVPHVPAVQVHDDRVDGWEHTVDLSVAASLRADPRRLAEACGVASHSRFSAVLSWHATGSSLRGTAARQPVADNSLVRLAGDLRGSELGGRLRLSVALVLDDAVDPDDTAPTRPGSILFREQRSWLLEGVGDRFPVERLDFRTSGVRHPGAAWILRWDHLDPEWDAHAAVRLQLNTRHPLVEELADTTGPQGELLHSVMRRDVMRELVLTALDLDGFTIDPAGWHEASLGQALSVLLASIFPDASVDEIRGLLRDDPAGFDAQIQGHAHFLRTSSQR